MTVTIKFLILQFNFTWDEAQTIFTKCIHLSQFNLAFFGICFVQLQMLFLVPFCCFCVWYSWTTGSTRCSPFVVAHNIIFVGKDYYLWEDRYRNVSLSTGNEWSSLKKKKKKVKGLESNCENQQICDSSQSWAKVMWLESKSTAYFSPIHEIEQIKN